VRAYPDETNYIVYVDEADIATAASIDNDLDDEISSPERKAFVIVRRAPPGLVESKLRPLPEGVKDDRASDLMSLISARKRVSWAQPSLSYVSEMHFNLAAVTAPRHHLIFGRRGAGKSALLVEARKSLDDLGSISCWINMQTLSNESPERVFLQAIESLVEALLSKTRYPCAGLRQGPDHLTHHERRIRRWSYSDW
jgi:hypothetical protein